MSGSEGGERAEIVLASLLWVFVTVGLLYGTFETVRKTIALFTG